MKINYLRKYSKDVSKTTPKLKSAIKKTESLFLNDDNHNSLHNKQINCGFADNMFSIRVNKQYRIVYYKYEDYVDFFRFINHDVYDRLTNDC